MTPEEREARAARIAGARITHQLCSAMECELAALVSELDRVTLAFENARQAAAANHLAKCDALESLDRVTAERDALARTVGNHPAISYLQEERDAALAQSESWRAGVRRWQSWAESTLKAAGRQPEGGQLGDGPAMEILGAALAQVERLRQLAAEAQVGVCSLACPATWPESEPRPHNGLCQRLALAATEPKTKADKRKAILEKWGGAEPLPHSMMAQDPDDPEPKPLTPREAQRLIDAGDVEPVPWEPKP